MEIQDPVVRAMATYISSAVFQRQFEQFFLDNALTFTDELEHQLEYMTIYIAFQHKFNEHMEGERSHSIPCLLLQLRLTGVLVWQASWRNRA